MLLRPPMRDQQLYLGRTDEYQYGPQYDGPIFSQDDLQEFKAHSATYSAAYGFGANQVNIVCKSRGLLNLRCIPNRAKVSADCMRQIRYLLLALRPYQSETLTVQGVNMSSRMKPFKPCLFACVAFLAALSLLTPSVLLSQPATGTPLADRKSTRLN